MQSVLTRRPVWRSQRTPEQVVLLVAVVLGGALILIAARHLGFFYDEWDYVQHRRAFTLHAYLAPHNGHPTVTAVLMYQVLFALVGLGHYVAYVVPVVLLHLGCVVLVFLLARPRVGERAALIPALLLLVLSASWQNLLWGAQETYMASIAGGLLAVFLIERGTRRADIGAAVALTIAVFSSTLGVPFVLGIAAELALQPARRRALWIPATTLVLYGLWTLGYQTGQGDDVKLSNLGAVTGYVADIASAAAAGIAGLNVTYGPVLLVGGGLAVALAHMQSPRAPGPTPRLAGLAATALGFWVLTALARAQLQEPAANRYVYLGAVMLMLIAVELLFEPPRWTVAGTTTVLVLLAGILLGNVYGLRTGERALRSERDGLRPELAAVEIAGPSAAPNGQIDSHLAPQLLPRFYLAAVAQHGSPSGGLAWLRTAPESRRQSADAALVRLGNVTSSPAAATCPRRAGTDVTRTIAPGAGIVVAATPGSDTRIQLRRFAAGFATGFPAPGPTGAVTLRTARDRAPDVPWVAHVTSRRPVGLCPA